MPRTVFSWDDLRQFGIDALTGEACGFGMRLLCDVTKQGKELLERFLGGTVQIKPDSNWNGGSKDDPHVGSVLLPRGIFTDLAAFCLLQTGQRTVYATKDGEAREAYDEISPEKRQEEQEIYRVQRVYRRSSAPGTGDRNEHAMSGRVE